RPWAARRRSRPGPLRSPLLSHHRLRQRSPAQSFFFQAEDGIRDATVTGVKTCALPISWEHTSGANHTPANFRVSSSAWAFVKARSEERRVGKECRDRWEQQH